MLSRSLLINYNSLPSTLDSLMPDNGLINLASSLIKAGHQTSILDFCTVSYIQELMTQEIHQDLAEAYFELNKNRTRLIKILPMFREILKKLEKRKQEILVDHVSKTICERIEDVDPHFIGFKLWSGEGFLGSIELAKIIKARFPHIKLIGGGPHNDYFHERTFDVTDVFEILAFGECEETIVDLAEWSIQKQDVSHINNIIYRNNGSIVKTPLKRIEDLDTCAEPIYDRSIYPALEGNEKVKVIMIDESRGCPNSCNFCIHPQKSGRTWRKRNPDSLVQIFKDVKTTLNTNCFRLAGSNPPPDLMQAICSKVIEENVDLHFVAFGHGTNTSEEYYDLLKRGGCFSLFFGVESGNPGLLRTVMNKTVSPDRLKTSMLACKQADIQTTASVIVPAPGETLQSLYDTYKLLVDTQPDGVSLYMPGVVPNSEWFVNKGKYGIEFAEDFFPKMMAYTIRFLMPPPLWEPLPYTIGGRDFMQMLILTGLIKSNLESEGILTEINDSTVLFAHKLGCTNSQMRDLNKRMFITGDVHQIAETVAQFNAAVSSH